MEEFRTEHASINEKETIIYELVTYAAILNFSLGKESTILTREKYVNMLANESLEELRLRKSVMLQSIKSLSLPD